MVLGVSEPAKTWIRDPPLFTESDLIRSTGRLRF